MALTIGTCQPSRDKRHTGTHKQRKRKIEMNKQQLKGMEVNVENVDLMVNVAKVPKDLQII